MACSNCSSGKTEDGLPKGCNNNGSCGTSSCNSKMNVFDWLANIQVVDRSEKFGLVEVKFKNGRKDFYQNPSATELFVGDVVAVEAASGFDIGTVSLIGELVKMQLKRYGIKGDKEALKHILGKPSQEQFDRWQKLIGTEDEIMKQARLFITRLKLQMKLFDVEYQADGSKAVFYYTSEERVDFRQLIKEFAEAFRVRVEMKQVGIRQEAARIGGIGSCGRELCCSTWLKDFRGVSTNAARYQQLSLNPQKLAGQCGKLKCCLNYELDSYLDAVKDFPNTSKPIETAKGNAYHLKTDIFKQIMWFSYTGELSNSVQLSVETANKFYKLNQKGKKPSDLVEYDKVPLERIKK